ncbi:MAG: hypothetical protein K0S58_3451 [Nitrospira sp.]|jgi:hypothetical protein|nr:hypothetical protein [Nitrospira sp.]
MQIVVMPFSDRRTERSAALIYGSRHRYSLISLAHFAGKFVGKREAPVVIVLEEVNPKVHAEAITPEERFLSHDVTPCSLYAAGVLG